MRIRTFIRRIFPSAIVMVVASCSTPDTKHHVVISTREQKLALLDQGNLMAVYPVSTSKFGLGDSLGSYRTPLGKLEVANKIGDGAAAGTVFKDRRRTGEIVAVNSPGRDPIVTRIIWLRGLERSNANAFNRCIYIHGTPEEKIIGKPASYGCVRMSSKDVAEVYAQIQIGALVRIIPDSLPNLPKLQGSPSKVIFTAATPQSPATPVIDSAAAGKSGAARKHVSSAASPHVGSGA
jgi:hypothetical protein